MNVGNFLKGSLVAAACALLPLLSHSSTVYMFGNAGTAGGALPGPCPNPANLNCKPVDTRALFLEAIDVTGAESFEGFTAGALNAGTRDVFSGAGTISQQEPPFPNTFLGARILSGTTSNGRFNTTGGAASGTWIQTDLDLILTLDDEVGAFGFYGTDFNDFGASLKISLYLGDSEVDDNVFIDQNGNAIAPSGNTGSLLFFGFGSTAKFNKIVFDLTQVAGTRDVVGFDDLIIGNLKATTPPNPMPEPGSLALAGLAMLAAGGARRLRRR